VLVALAGCGFSHGTAVGDHAPIVDDSAADFAAGTTSEVAIDPLGLIVPDAFARTGLHARGYRTHQLTTTTTWADLTDALLGPMAGERYGERPVTDWMNDRPHGLGLTAADVDSFTVVYDGELYLAGPTTLQLGCDDLGFLEIELPDGGQLVRCIWNQPAPSSIALTPPAPGWYPIRGAVSEAAGVANFLLSQVISGVPQPIAPKVLRARVTDAHGAIVIGANDRIFTNVQPTTSVEASLVDRDFAGGPPTYDLPNVYNGAGNFALRYAAQLRIDTAGTYVFVVDPGSESGDYERLFIDRAPVAQHWPGMPQMPSGTIDLAVGWHDLVLDYADLSAADHVALRMQAPGAASATAIPSSQLRPVRTHDLLTSSVGGNTNLIDASASGPSTVTIGLPITAPAAAVLDSADFLFYLSGGEPRNELELALAGPTATEPLALPATPAYEATWDYMPADTGLAGQDMSQGFQAMFTDTVQDGSSGQIQAPILIASYHGGPLAPFAKDMQYTSAPHATVNAVAIGAVTVTGDLAGATLVIEVRTGDDATLASAPWVAVANGDAPAVEAAAFVQYRLTLTGDGWQYPSIDKVAIDYTAPGS
jgi:hypothetical protein